MPVSIVEAAAMIAWMRRGSSGASGERSEPAASGDHGRVAGDRTPVAETDDDLRATLINAADRAAGMDLPAARDHGIADRMHERRRIEEALALD